MGGHFAVLRLSNRKWYINGKWVSGPIFKMIFSCLSGKPTLMGSLPLAWYLSGFMLQTMRVGFQSQLSLFPDGWHYGQNPSCSSAFIRMVGVCHSPLRQKTKFGFLSGWFWKIAQSTCRTILYPGVITWHGICWACHNPNRDLANWPFHR